MAVAGKIAIVHDRYTQDIEAERVVEEIATLLPEADLLPATDSERLPLSARSSFAKSSRMGYLPAGGQFHLLHPLAIRELDLSGYAIVISSRFGFTRGVACPEEAVHVCYCHGPTPALWRYREYARWEGLNPAAGLLLMPLRAGLRRVDVASSLQPDYYIAKSHTAAEEIRRCYGRRAFVIHPPVDVSRYHPSTAVEDYYLIVSSLLSRNRIDAVIAACNSARSRLLIVGEGPDRHRLESLAGPTVVLLGRRTENEIAELTARCLAVFCLEARDEFDTLPLKANAAGRPAIALGTDGAQETIIDRETGILYDDCSRPAIVEAMKECGAREWNADVLRKYSRTFDAAAFRSKFTGVLDDILGTQFMHWATA